MNIANHHSCTNSRDFVVNGVYVKHQISDKTWGFAHRIVVPVVAEDTEWVSYNAFSIADTPIGKFGACMGSWQNIFPEVFQLIVGKAE